MKVLLIGAGAMGGAILRGCLDHQVWKKEDVLMYTDIVEKIGNHVLGLLGGTTHE